MPTIKRPPGAAIVLALVAVAVAFAVAGIIALRGTGTPMPDSPVHPAAVPERAWATLRLIDEAKWPRAANAPGTKGGEPWHNREGKLPRTTSYREWDVNPKSPGHNRDAERIVTGRDRSAWYTGDHYRNFTRMR